MCSLLGSGTSLILELFLELSKYNTKNRIRFAWWGAEENGLLGSRHYCSNLDVDDVNDLLVYLNFDMVSKGFFGVADTDGSEYGSVAPPGSEVTERIFREYFEDQGLEVTPATLTNGSDYAAFWQILNKPFGFLHTGKNYPYLSRWPFLLSLLVFCSDFTRHRCRAGSMLSPGMRYNRQPRRRDHHYQCQGQRYSTDYLYVQDC